MEKGKDDFLYNQPKRTPLHVIAAVTDTQLVTLLVLTNTIKSDDFQGFLSDAMDKMKQLCSDGKQPFVLLYDNASVHKTKAVRSQVEKEQCLSILNCPYAPDLNFCEKFIRLHKRKLQESLMNLR